MFSPHNKLLLAVYSDKLLFYAAIPEDRVQGAGCSNNLQRSITHLKTNLFEWNLGHPTYDFFTATTCPSSFSCW